ncbi:serine hydrolase [Geodermatophilus ruber]|uniref:Beta-lactamase enzyme family protein n=1 Tax=Geodermatophilus ruber TaxID=504800 RepID=A0A1I4BSF6_9ACTN|nr:serine hydrolase [Geodermatophilus ruber]SFK71463.1 Beta-lactamase enzyme family protein [Geodermatophilus ruber]
MALFVLLLVELPPAGRAAAVGPPAADVVAAVTAAYGDVGTLAVVVTRREAPVTGVSPRALEARSARTAAVTADNGLADRPFPTASLVKLFVAENLLHRARTGAITLTSRDFARMQDMIRRSDDPATSAFWSRFGGEQMVRDVAARYGLTGTAPPRVQGEWGETTTTARDLARFLSLLPVQADPADAAALTVWMRTATPVAADGFDQRFGILGSVPELPAVKQGWMCCVGGRRHLHSVGVLGHRVVVLLSEVPRSVGYDTARSALAAAAAAIPPPMHP